MLAKTDQANTILRESIFNVSHDKETIELMSNTILSQMEISPYLDNQRNKVYLKQNLSHLQLNEDIIIVCDNFIPFGSMKLN